MVRMIPLCQLKGGCMGCCGRNYVSKEEVKVAILQNTKDFDSINPQTKAKLIKFRDRAQPQELRYGVCFNIIEQKGRLFCPLHPAVNKGVDLRINHCDVDFQCRTAKLFITWDKNRQERFIDYIQKKELDNLDYSLEMDNGHLLDSFEAEEKEKGSNSNLSNK